MNIKFKYNKFIITILITLCASFYSFSKNSVFAIPPYEIYPPVAVTTVPCTPACPGCVFCTVEIPTNHVLIKMMARQNFMLHHIWMIDEFFTRHIRYAMALMTSQMTAVAMQQAKIIGTFFDAKHQLETQRLFQQLMAEAHKDYQPSEGICDIGTNSRGLLPSERKSDLTHLALANHVMQRQLRSGQNSAYDDNSDLYSRVDLFKQNFCNVRDNGYGLRYICGTTGAPKENRNKDVDYTRTVDSVLTLDIDFSKDSAVNSTNLTSDEKSAFGLMANLFANDVLPIVSQRTLADGDGNPKEASYRYLDLRSVAAKRSVAQNSISAIIAERAAGEKAMTHADFLRSAISELGVPNSEIDLILGKNPSYFAQMEVLTKKLYENPVFYTELYDKPTNVLRKRAAIRAINLMQERDYYKSLLRSEAVLSVLLETMLTPSHDRIHDNMLLIGPNKDPI